MSASSVKQLRERWRTPAGRELALEAAAWLAKGAVSDAPSWAATHEGRVDLRGLEFPSPARVNSVVIANSTFEVIGGFPVFAATRWEHIDLRASVIRHARFHDAWIHDCLFDQADLHDWRLWNSQVSDSSFERADMTGSAIGTGERGANGVNRWHRVSFDRADLKRAVVSECDFVDCTFRNTKLKSVKFNYATFDGVKFEGLLDGVLFEARKFSDTRDPGPLKDVDFRGVLFRNCEMRAYKFENVQFDHEPGLRVIVDYARVGTRALKMAAVSTDPIEQQVSGTIQHSLKLYSEGDTIYVPADFVSAVGIECAETLDRLYDRAQRELGLTV